MSYETLSFTVTGVAPLIMHNGQTADPTNPHSKSIAEITKKRLKTDADQEEIARREWRAGLYISNGAPCVPWQALEAALVGGSKKEKSGMQAKSGLLVEDNAPLIYDGPTDIDELWNDKRFVSRVPVRVGQARVIRTRPIFEHWSATFSVKYLPSILNPAQVRSFLVAAGIQVGLCDWRPRYGRFSVA